MRTRTKFSIAAGALGAVAMTAALLPGTVASGTSSTTIPGDDVVRLHLNKDADYFRYQRPTDAGGEVFTQAITARNCVVSPNPPPSLVMLTATPTPGAVGLVEDGLGVKAGNDGTGTPCGLVDAGQALTLSLVRSPNDPVLRDKVIDFAELDIEGKFDVTVLAQAFLDGDKVWEGRLETGPGSDSGPDSGDGDNYRWKIDPPNFDQLVLSVDSSTSNGSFSLEGGEDATKPEPGGVGESLKTSDTIFQLTDDITGVIGCGETVPSVGGGDSPLATLSRGQNDKCTPIPYLLRSEPDNIDNSVLLQKNASSQPGANFLLEITWEPEPMKLPLEVTKIDYGLPDGPIEVIGCIGTSDAPQLPPDREDFETWCLASQQWVLAGDGNIKVTEAYFGAGDPRWAR
jgi:hypothetical protein